MYDTWLEMPVSKMISTSTSWNNPFIIGVCRARQLTEKYFRVPIVQYIRSDSMVHMRFAVNRGHTGFVSCDVSNSSFIALKLDYCFCWNVERTDGQTNRQTGLSVLVLYGPYITGRLHKFIIEKYYCALFIYHHRKLPYMSSDSYHVTIFGHTMPKSTRTPKPSLHSYDVTYYCNCHPATYAVVFSH